MQFELAPSLEGPLAIGSYVSGGIAIYLAYRLDKNGFPLFDVDKRPKSALIRALVIGVIGLLFGGFMFFLVIGKIALPLLAEVLRGSNFNVTGEVVRIGPTRRSAEEIMVKLADGRLVIASLDWWLQSTQPQVICSVKLGGPVQVVGFENRLGWTYKEIRAPDCYLKVQH
jgi:hypothetical protein